MDVKRYSSELSQYEMILLPLTVLPFGAILTVNVYDHLYTPALTTTLCILHVDLTHEAQCINTAEESHRV